MNNDIRNDEAYSSISKLCEMYATELNVNDYEYLISLAYFTEATCVDEKKESIKKCMKAISKNVADGTVSGNKLSFQKYVLRSRMYDVLMKANSRLMVMSRNQYELRQPLNGDVLAMEVFDNYTGSNRPVESLSGGESFLASLALALGLADVIQSYSGRIHLDAMFIDEGFGTLDPETLDIAMKALLKLRASGRMIGIISHVEALKERIDRRIDVVKDPEKGSRVKLVC
ncbi:SbcC/MukB-like Walker B domain-containing protein [Anaerovibrio sp. RM50]|uniref:SbcC/MukB-like Walker B domain-containing protein n=1 Tax=Anaerovibrio sp. RM50 TaxID=1200557 RepID=UPI0005636150|nr:SbcC/MukB-like Walker B domain-containing protein [Anaerovibrio sp. RM50]